MKDRNRLRDKQLRVWISDDEESIINDKCKISNMNKSDYIRNIIVYGEIKKIDSEAIVKVSNVINQNNFELNKIGNNINQIAKKVNEQNSYTHADIIHLKEEFEQIRKLHEHLANEIMNRLYDLN